MKHLRLTLENEEFKELKKQKGDRTWRDFILTLVPTDEAEDKKNE